MHCGSWLKYAVAALVPALLAVACEAPREIAAPPAAQENAIGDARLRDPSERPVRGEEPVMFVPGEILLGPKVEEQLAKRSGPLGLSFAGKARTPTEAEMAQALEAASAEAVKDARTVLARAAMEGAVRVSPGGLVTIDLAPPRASPTALRLGQAGTGEGAEAPAAALPEVAVDVDRQCPPGGPPEGDLALKTICAMERLAASRQFAFVEKNYVVGIDFDRAPIFGQKKKTEAPAPPPPPPGAATTPNDPLLNYQWDLRPRGVGPGESPGGAGFADFWAARHFGSRNVRVAVIDTGVEFAHPDFADSPNLAQGLDFVTDAARSGDGDGVDRNPNDEGDACGPALDHSFHGSHVAGTIGAGRTNDGRGVAGALWNVTVLPVRAIGRCGGELADVINAIRWAAGAAPAITAGGERIPNMLPADVINLSLSVAVPCPQALQAAIDDAVGAGAVVVVAAGNRSSPAGRYAPANCQNVIVAGAADATGSMAYYSNFGGEIDVLAPGGDLYADANRDGRPDGVLSIRTTRNDCLDPQTGMAASICRYGYLQGTSMAAPHVSAALAMVRSAYDVRGRALEDLFLTRGLSRLDAQQQCAIPCAEAPEATPLPGRPGFCARACGAGALDLTRLAAEAPPPR